MKTGPSKQSEIGVKPVLVVSALFVLGGLALVAIGMQTGWVDPLWGAVPFGMGGTCGLYAVLRTAGSNAGPVIDNGALKMRQRLSANRARYLRRVNRFDEAAVAERRAEALARELQSAKEHAR